MIFSKRSHTLLFAVAILALAAVMAEGQGDGPEGGPSNGPEAGLLDSPVGGPVDGTGDEEAPGEAMGAMDASQDSASTEITADEPLVEDYGFDEGEDADWFDPSEAGQPMFPPEPTTPSEPMSE